MAREAFMFRHRSYSTLRVVMIDGKLYYPLADIMRLFNLTPSETFDAMADSEGELKIFYVTEEIEMLIPNSTSVTARNKGVSVLLKVRFVVTAEYAAWMDSC